MLSDPGCTLLSVEANSACSRTACWDGPFGAAWHAHTQELKLAYYKSAVVLNGYVTKREHMQGKVSSLMHKFVSSLIHKGGSAVLIHRRAVQHDARRRTGAPPEEQHGARLPAH
eukprot:2004601-Pyramimonas_sp.AAC.1